MVSVPPLDPIPLPATVPWLSFLLGVTFLLHLIPMNLLLGCCFIAPVAGWAGRGPKGAAYRTLSRQLTALLPIFMALAITLGVAPLLFLQVLYGRFFFTSSILMGWPWLGVILLLLTAYPLLYLAAWRRDPLGRGHPAVVLCAGILLALVAFLFTNNMTRMLRPGTFGEVYRSDPRGWSLNLSDPTVWPRFLHFFMASVAVSGLFICFMALVRRRAEGEEYASRIARLGASLFIHPTFLQLLVGPWLLLRLPAPIRSRFLGGTVAETSSLGFGILAALVTLILVIQAPHRRRPGLALGWALGGLLLTLTLMVRTRHLLREAALAELSGEPTVAPQPLAMAVFAGTLLAAALLIAWMLRDFLASHGTVPSGGAETRHGRPPGGRD